MKSNPAFQKRIIIQGNEPPLKYFLPPQPTEITKIRNRVVDIGRSIFNFISPLLFLGNNNSDQKSGPKNANTQNGTQIGQPKQKENKVDKMNQKRRMKGSRIIPMAQIESDPQDYLDSNTWIPPSKQNTKPQHSIQKKVKKQKGAKDQMIIYSVRNLKQNSKIVQDLNKKKQQDKIIDKKYEQLCKKKRSQGELLGENLSQQQSLKYSQDDIDKNQQDFQFKFQKHKPKVHDEELKPRVRPRNLFSKNRISENDLQSEQKRKRIKENNQIYMGYLQQINQSRIKTYKNIQDKMPMIKKQYQQYRQRNRRSRNTQNSSLEQSQGQICIRELQKNLERVDSRIQERKKLYLNSDGFQPIKPGQYLKLQPYNVQAVVSVLKKQLRQQQQVFQQLQQKPIDEISNTVNVHPLIKPTFEMPNQKQANLIFANPGIQPKSTQSQNINQQKNTSQIKKDQIPLLFNNTAQPSFSNNTDIIKDNKVNNEIKPLILGNLSGSSLFKNTPAQAIDPLVLSDTKDKQIKDVSVQSKGIVVPSLVENVLQPNQAPKQTKAPIFSFNSSKPQQLQSISNLNKKQTLQVTNKLKQEPKILSFMGSQNKIQNSPNIFDKSKLEFSEPKIAPIPNILAGTSPKKQSANANEASESKGLIKQNPFLKKPNKTSVLPKVLSEFRPSVFANSSAKNIFPDLKVHSASPIFSTSKDNQFSTPTKDIYNVLPKQKIDPNIFNSKNETPVQNDQNSMYDESEQSASKKEQNDIGLTVQAQPSNVPPGISIFSGNGFENLGGSAKVQNNMMNMFSNSSGSFLSAPPRPNIDIKKSLQMFGSRPMQNAQSLWGSSDDQSKSKREDKKKKSKQQRIFS